MKVYVSQVYVEPSVHFPFSQHFQQFMYTELSKRITATTKSSRTFSADTNLIFNMSAKAGIKKAEIHGPATFEDTGDVEYTIFLPFVPGEIRNQGRYRRILRHLLKEIIAVCQANFLDSNKLASHADDLIEQIVSNPKMIDNEWLD